MIEDFFVANIDHKRADLDTRGLFSFDDVQLRALILEVKSLGIKDFFVINTCNRTELYAWAGSSEILVKLLCKYTRGNKTLFERMGVVLSGEAAIRHVFRVGTGLESQILGDFEVIGQLKKSFYQSKRYGLIHSRSERLINSVIQASKRIKNETEISSGAASVAFASVQYILQNVQDVSQKNTLLFGTGKIGRNTCENLIKHTGNDHIVLINRTHEKANKIAAKFSVNAKPFEDFASEIRKADILIVATGALQHTVGVDLIHTTKPLLILDLSLPRNVDPKVDEMEGVDVVHLDALSQVTHATLKKREKYIPQANAIADEIKAEFIEWLSYRKFAPTLKAFKEKLLEQHSQIQKNIIANDVIATQTIFVQKLTGRVASFLKENPDKTDDTMTLLQDIFQLDLASHE